MMKQLSPGVFASVILLITLGVVALRQSVSVETDHVAVLQKKVARLERETAEAELRETLARSEIGESRDFVAQVLPDVLKGRPKDSSTYHLRNIASVVNSTNSSLKIERASSLLERSKEDFRLKKFDDSNAGLQRLLRLYPDSLHGPEARFLLVEGFYQSRDFEACIESVEEMIRLYPESELTGFALLRLARIYETRDRVEDAAEIYRSIASHFSQPELKKQSLAGLKAVDL